MVIDKTGIMSILRTSEEDLKNHIGEDSILITTIYDDFSIEQIRDTFQGEWKSIVADHIIE